MFQGLGFPVARAPGPCSLPRAGGPCYFSSLRNFFIGLLAVVRLSGQNWGMRSARFLVCLLLVAAVLVDLAALLMVRAAGGADLEWPHPLLAGLFSLAFSQVNLVTFWAAMGRSILPWRLAALAAVVTLWSLALAVAARGAGLGYTSDDWTFLLAGPPVVLLVLLSFFRVRGWRLAHLDQVEPMEAKTPLQFTLGYLLAWITATAITLGMFRWTVDFELLIAGGYDWSVGPDVIAVILLNSGLGLATVYGVLGAAGMVFRALVILLSAGIAVIATTRLPNSPEYSQAFAFLWLLEVLWLVAALSVLRVAGFRLKRLRAAK